MWGFVALVGMLLLIGVSALFGAGHDTRARIWRGLVAVGLQRAVLALGLGVFALVSLCPPFVWQVQVSFRDPLRDTGRSAGRSWLWKPPTNYPQTSRVNREQLHIEWIVVGVLTAGACHERDAGSETLYLLTAPAFELTARFVPPSCVVVRIPDGSTTEGNGVATVFTVIERASAFCCLKRWATSRGVAQVPLQWCNPN